MDTNGCFIISGCSENSQPIQIRADAETPGTISSPVSPACLCLCLAISYQLSARTALVLSSQPLPLTLGWAGHSGQAPRLTRSWTWPGPGRDPHASHNLSTLCIAITIHRTKHAQWRAGRCGAGRGEAKPGPGDALDGLEYLTHILVRAAVLAEPGGLRGETARRGGQPAGSTDHAAGQPARPRPPASPCRPRPCIHG